MIEKNERHIVDELTTAIVERSETLENRRE